MTEAAATRRHGQCLVHASMRLDKRHAHKHAGRRPKFAYWLDLQHAGSKGAELRAHTRDFPNI